MLQLLQVTPELVNLSTVNSRLINSYRSPPSQRAGHLPEKKASRYKRIYLIRNVSILVIQTKNKRKPAAKKGSWFQESPAIDRKNAEDRQKQSWFSSFPGMHVGSPWDHSRKLSERVKIDGDNRNVMKIRRRILLIDEANQRHSTRHVDSNGPS